MAKRVRSTSPYDSLQPVKRHARSTSLSALVTVAVAVAAELHTCTLPLTLENLTQHTLSCESQSTHPQAPTMSSRTGSPTRTTWDNRMTLRSYNIHVDVARPLPTQLQQHVDTVLLQTRPGPRSPNAKRIVQQRLAASLDNETTGIRKLEPLLLFAGEDDPGAANGVPMISSKLNFNLDRDFLPTAPPGKKLPRLSQPQPDTIIGYLSNNQALSTEPPLATAFDVNAEEALVNFTLNPVLLFPFLTSQWKPATGDSSIIAHSQSARDGATIVRYLDQFYTTARGQPPTECECSHISFTCDIQMLNIWLHWRELDASGTATYYMKSIYDCTLRNEKQLLAARELLWNHIDYALTHRLQSLKQAIGPFSRRFVRSAKMASSTRSDSTPVMLPPTPSSTYSVSSEPVKKRSKRARSNDEDEYLGS
ncbi:hypothetical protein P153DRAFT_401718 [Dothidotthia symphoricarpi CBS 119687]|uniref:DUF7924 domain-containing protein n=1 Tax=Dothidotthia symphoricarpi CBS 119687 TaxID=1392245 RepID=A0A6A5ZXS7_9PLEO|nr:uncharacterized protein P153DRAFT_401718 [Dothidotthia symphoricarpi CBS 119687]KAF2123825.1 hypothetical protein P153DRAFT_401718 [Dothidotthia symphoricarpi CBS 119687]